MSVKILAALGVASFILSSLFVGFRLIGLWWRTRGKPELFAALAILSIGPVAFGLFVPAVDLAASEPDLSRILYAVAAGAGTFGTAAVASFTISVFHAGSRLARILAHGVMLALAGTWMGFVAGGDLDLRRLPGLFRNANSILQIGIFLWSSLESLAFWRMMRRRTLLGLADPLVTVRFALWGVALGVGAANLSISFIWIVLGRSPNGMVALAVGTLGALCAICLMLAFQPPQRYRAYVRLRARRANR